MRHIIASSAAALLALPLLVTANPITVGNNMAGASLKYHFSHSNTATSFLTKGQVDADGRIFNKQVQLGRGLAELQLHRAGGGRFATELYLGNKRVANIQRTFANNTLNYTSPAFIDIRAGGDHRLSLGGAGFTAKGNAHVKAYAEAKVAPIPGGVKASAGPVVDVTAKASGSASVIVAAAGVRGAIDLAKARLTANVELRPTASGGCSTYSATGSTGRCHGELEAFVRLGFKTWDLTFVKLNQPNRTITFASATRCF
jgi:hypothetical protein